jgi:EAL domain-containing protein (putative c-di-GMP-specific phosphodiesterase class I)
MRNAIWLSKPLNFDLLRNALTLHGNARPEWSHGTKSLIKPDAAHVKLALQKREFYPVFQPKVQIPSGEVIGCEALARWVSPDFRARRTGHIFPAAERADYIKSLTMVLLEDSVVAAKEFIRNDPAFVLASNLSASLLSDIALPEEIEALLQEHGFPTASLTLEVTESVAMSDVSLAMDVLLRLRTRGIGISLDDFGTGYSSLAALSRMPFTEIKIDKSFVTNCPHDEDVWRIVRGAVTLGHEFKLEVVAEGVEDQLTWQALDSIGCDIGQGYYFSAALSAAEFTAWCQKWDRGPHHGEAA